MNEFMTNTSETPLWRTDKIFSDNNFTVNYLEIERGMKIYRSGRRLIGNSKRLDDVEGFFRVGLREDSFGPASYQQSVASTRNFFFAFYNATNCVVGEYRRSVKVDRHRNRSITDRG